MPLDELIMFKFNWDRWLRRRGTPATGKGMAMHHVDGNPYNNDVSNLRIVHIAKNRRAQRD